MNGSARLSDLASMVRSLKAPVSAIAQDANSFIAGDSEGTVSAWSVLDGAHLWSIEVEPSVSSIAVADNIVAIAHGASITGVNYDDGAVIWANSVEGACDLVVFDEQSLWVTSSVYEIEIQDYVACRIMRVEPHQGLVEQSIPLASKAWTLDIFGRGCILGLGRPQPGIYTLQIGQDGLNHLEGSPRIPIIRSTTSSDNRISFTTSDQQAIQIDQTGEILDLEKDVLLAGYTHDGKWIRYGESGELDKEKNQAESFDEAPHHFTSNDEMTLISTKKPESSGAITLGKTRVNWAHSSEITIVQSYLDRTILGCFDGEIFFLENKVIKRRISKSEFFNHDDSSIRARLRMLRSGEIRNTMEEK